MTLLELCTLLRPHLKKLIVVPVLCGVICLLGYLLFSFIMPSYLASASVLSVNGDIAAVASLASSIAKEETEVSVTAMTSTNDRVVDITASGPSSNDCIKAANNVANKLADAAVKQGAAANAIVTEAESTQKAGGGSVLFAVAGFLGSLFCLVAFYVARDELRGTVHIPESLSKSGLRYLGTLDGNEASQRIVAANLRLSIKEKGLSARTVFLVPTSKRVHNLDAYNLIAQSAEAEGVPLDIAPALDDEPSILHKDREVDLVVAVIEAELSTFAEVKELVYELDIADIKPVGFIFLSYNAFEKR